MRISDWSSDVCSSDLSSAITAAPSAPLAATDLSGAAPVRPTRGAGAGWRTPSTAAVLCRAAKCGCAAASIGDRTGAERKRVVEGKSVYVRVDLGGRRIIKKTTTTNKRAHKQPRQ